MDSPRVVPVAFVWNAARFVICTATNALKLRALATHPKVALTIDTNTFPPHVLLVHGTASSEVVDGVPPEYLEASKKAGGSERVAGVRSASARNIQADGARHGCPGMGEAVGL
jgi:Pyridoxamine 5'-phosphate oxidase